VVPSGRVIVTGLAALVPEGGSSRLLRAVRRLTGTVALQAVIAACRWRRHGLDFTAWLTSEATQDPGKVEICPVRTTDALAPVSGSRQLACGVARARQETNSDISLLAGALGAGRRSIPEGGYSPCLTCAISPASFSAVPFTSYFAAF
jgi:hypothetical protein